MGKNRSTKILKIIIPVFIGFFFIWLSYRKFTPEQLGEIKRHFLEANYWYLALSVFLGVLSHLSRAYRWFFVLGPMGYKPHFKNSAMAVFIAYFMNLFIPRSGEVSRAVVIARYDKVPFEKAMGTIVMERLVDLFLLLAFVVLALVLQYDYVKDYLFKMLETVDLGKSLRYALLGVLGLVLAWVILRRFVSLKSGRFANFVEGFKEGLRALFRLKKPWAFAFHTLFIWAMYLAMFYVSTLALEETSHITLAQAVTTFIVGGIAIAFTNGGFGSYPYLVGEVFALYSVPVTAGVAFGWIIWTAQFSMFVVAGCLSFILLPLLNAEKPKP